MLRTQIINNFTTDIELGLTICRLLPTALQTHNFLIMASNTPLFCYKNSCFRLVAVLVSLQIHVLEGGEIRIYSRNSENNTSKYPDIIARMPKVVPPGNTAFQLVLECLFICR